MKIISFISGSSGNLHLLEISGKRILLECGISFRDIMKCLGFNLNLDACLLSHYHKDHAKSVLDIIKHGINLYCTEETAYNLLLEPEYIHNLSTFKTFEACPMKFEIGSLLCTMLPTNHDTAGSVAFVIDDLKNKVLYATDTGFFNYKINGLTHIMIECNYSEETITEESYIERVRETHMSLDDVINFLNINDLSCVKEIHLIHVSKNNGDKELFKRKIQELTGKMVII